MVVKPFCLGMDLRAYCVGGCRDVYTGQVGVGRFGDGD